MNATLNLYAIALGLTVAVCVIMLIRSLRRGWRPKEAPTRAAYNTGSDPEPARQAVIRNISLFAPLLPQLLTGRINGRDWHQAVKRIGNPELHAIARKAGGNPRSWLRIMEMWGISHDRQSVFTATGLHIGRYTNTDGSPLIPGSRYMTKDPCWLLTDSLGATLILTGTAERVKNEQIPAS